MEDEGCKEPTLCGRTRDATLRLRVVANSPNARLVVLGLDGCVRAWLAGRTWGRRRTVRWAG